MPVPMTEPMVSSTQSQSPRPRNRAGPGRGAALSDPGAPGSAGSERSAAATASGVVIAGILCRSARQTPAEPGPADRQPSGSGRGHGGAGEAAVEVELGGHALHRVEDVADVLPEVELAA